MAIDHINLSRVDLNLGQQPLAQTLGVTGGRCGYP